MMPDQAIIFLLGVLEENIAEEEGREGEQPGTSDDCMRRKRDDCRNDQMISGILKNEKPSDSHAKMIAGRSTPAALLTVRI